MGKTLKAWVEIAGKDSSGGAFRSLIESVDKAEAKFSAFGDLMSPIGRGFSTVGTIGISAIGAVAGAVGGIVAGSIALAKGAQEDVDAIADLSQATGLAVETIANMTYVAKLSGVEAGEAEAGYRKFSLGIADVHKRGSALRKTLAALDPQFARQLATTKSTDEAYRLSIETLARYTDSNKRVAVAKALFGKAALGVNAITSQGTDRLHELMAAGEKYNEVTGDMVQKAGDFGDAQDNLSFALGTLKRVVGVELMPVLTEGALALADFIAENKGEIRSNVAVLAANLSEGIGNIIRWVKENPGAITKFFGDAADAANTLIVAVKDARKSFEDLQRLVTGAPSRQEEALKRAGVDKVYGIPTAGEIETGKINEVERRTTGDLSDRLSTFNYVGGGPGGGSMGLGRVKEREVKVKIEMKVPKGMAPMSRVTAPGVSVEFQEDETDIIGHSWN